MPVSLIRMKFFTFQFISYIKLARCDWDKSRGVAVHIRRTVWYSPNSVFTITEMYLSDNGYYFQIVSHNRRFDPLWVSVHIHSMTSHVPDFSDPILFIRLEVLSASIIRNKVLLGIFSWAEISLILIRLFLRIRFTIASSRDILSVPSVPLSVSNHGSFI